MLGPDYWTINPGPNLIQPFGQVEEAQPKIGRPNAQKTFFAKRPAMTIKVLLHFFAPIAGFAARELAVAETFGFSFFGFLVSFLLFLPLAILCPSKMQRSDAKMASVTAVLSTLLYLAPLGQTPQNLASHLSHCTTARELPLAIVTVQSRLPRAGSP